jgi:hypothetical protein
VQNRREGRTAHDRRRAAAAASGSGWASEGCTDEVLQQTCINPGQYPCAGLLISKLEGVLMLCATDAQRSVTQGLGCSCTLFSPLAVGCSMRACGTQSAHNSLINHIHSSHPGQPTRPFAPLRLHTVHSRAILRNACSSSPIRSRATPCAHCNFARNPRLQPPSIYPTTMFTH